MLHSLTPERLRHVANLYSVFQRFGFTGKLLIEDFRPEVFAKINKKMANRLVEFVVSAGSLWISFGPFRSCLPYGEHGEYRYCIAAFNSVVEERSRVFYFPKGARLCLAVKGMSATWQSVEADELRRIKDNWSHVQRLKLRARQPRNILNIPQRYNLAKTEKNLKTLRKNFIDNCQIQHKENKSKIHSIPLNDIDWLQTQRLQQLRSGAAPTISELTTLGFGKIIKLLKSNSPV